jgi:anti-sigma B factor antagonist
MTPSAPGELSVEISLAGQIANVALTGELDIATAPALEQKLSELPREGVERLMLDLRELAFIDSTGLRVVLGLADGLTPSTADVVIVKGPEAVQRVFALTGADRELVMIDDPSELDELDARA